MKKICPDILEIRGPVRTFFECWRHGFDLQSLYSQTTIYRYKHLLWRQYGIDIDFSAADYEADGLAPWINERKMQ